MRGCGKIPPTNGKGDAVGDLDSSSRVPRWLQAALFVLLLAGLFFSRPPLRQFFSEVIQPTARALNTERSESGLLGFLSDVERKLIPGAGSILDAAEDSDREGLQDDILQHTLTRDWLIASYFKIQYDNCLSDYLGIAGTLLTLSDRCGIEPYRAKGAS